LRQSAFSFLIFSVMADSNGFSNEVRIVQYQIQRTRLTLHSYTDIVE